MFLLPSNIRLVGDVVSCGFSKSVDLLTVIYFSLLQQFHLNVKVRLAAAR